jgi:hypothetical protein
MNHTECYKTLESRSAAALHLKVLSHRATGWVLDGPLLEVTDFGPRKRSVKRYSQRVFRPGLSPMNWSPQ